MADILSPNPAKRTSDETAGIVFGLIGVLIFSATLPATRIAVEVFDPWFVTFGRALLATLASIVTFAILKRRLPSKHVWTLFTIGLLLIYGFPGFVALAMLTIPSAHGGVILGILPLATAIFATLLAGERPSAMFWIWGIVGAIIIVVFALRDGEWGFAAGDIWLAIAGISAAAGYVMSGKLTQVMPGWEVISWALILTAPISLIGTLFLWHPSYVNVTSHQAVAFLYLGLGSMYLGFFAWNKGLKMGGLARVGQLQLLQTFFTLAIAALLLGEAVTLETIAFAAAIVVVVLLGRRAKVTR